MPVRNQPPTIYDFTRFVEDLDNRMRRMEKILAEMRNLKQHEPEYIPVKTSCEMIGNTPDTVIRWITNGYVYGHKSGKRYMVDFADLKAYMAKNGKRMTKKHIYNRTINRQTA